MELKLLAELRISFIRMRSLFLTVLKLMTLSGVAEPRKTQLLDGWAASDVGLLSGTALKYIVITYVQRY